MKVRKDFLSIAIPDITQEEKAELSDALDSGWISSGPRVKEFEKQFSEYHGVKNSVATSSCTAALFISCKVLGISDGDFVIIPAITWPSTANVIEHLNATPLFCDVESDTLNMKKDDVENYIKQFGNKIKAIIPVHYSGLPADIAGFTQVSEEYGIPIIYDAAHAVFSSYRNKMIGGFGSMSCFSFYATKNLTMGDGGVITTDNDGIAEQCRMWSCHGLPADSWTRYNANNSGRHVQCIVPGYKFNLTDIQAALGIAQLRRKDELLNKRNKLVECYNDLLRNFDWLQTPVFETESGRWGNHVFTIKITDEEINRDKLMSELKKLNIGTNLHFYPVHKMEYYEKKYPGVKLPNSEFLSKRILSLPLCTKYSEDDLKYVAEALSYVHQKRFTHESVTV